MHEGALTESFPCLVPLQRLSELLAEAPSWHRQQPLVYDQTNYLVALMALFSFVTPAERRAARTVGFEVWAHFADKLDVVMRGR